MNKARQYHSDLASLLHGLHPVPSALNTQIHGMVSDSRNVKQGDLFIALKGINAPAEKHVKDAIARGAAAVLIECDGQDRDKCLDVCEDETAVELYVPNLRAHVGSIAHRFFHKPSEELQVIGVTGTNGKTSVVNYIAQFFASIGVSTAVIGTLGYGMCAQGEELIDTNHTTPDVVNVHRYLAHLRDAGAELVAMEVSSHGLAQGRVDAVCFEGAVFTNLSRDHLDYHQTMAEYADSKAKLFGMPDLKYAVINADDSFGVQMLRACAPDMKKVRYAVESPSEVKATELSVGLGVSASINVGADALAINSALSGKFNVYNLLAVLGVAHARGCSLEELANIDKVRPVAGRMELFKSEGRPAMVVDYAHTPDALENILKTVKAFTVGRVITVFGCGGDRDQGKRKEMGLISKAYSDFSLITNDNPRTESPQKIIADIEDAFDGDASLYSVIEDRRSAIEKAFAMATAQDLVLVAGKGHENYQEINGVRNYFSDAQCCLKLLGISNLERNIGVRS